MMRLITIAFLSAAFVSVPVYAASCASGAPNLITNCGFETGDFTGWTLSGHDSLPGYDGIAYGVDTVDAHSGTYGAYLGGFGGVLDLSQSLATNAGTSYTVTFWLAQSPAPNAPYLNSFSLDFGTVSVLVLNEVPNLAFAEYSFVALASSATTLLNFGFRDDLGFFSIDDVSVMPVPEASEGGLVLISVIALISLRPAK